MSNIAGNFGGGFFAGGQPQSRPSVGNQIMIATILDFLGTPGGLVANPPPTGPAPTPAPPAGVPEDLRRLLLALPIAHEGDVITPEYHNALRAVVLAMAQRLGVGAFAGTSVYTFAPHFYRHGNDPQFLLTQGVAAIPTAATGGNRDARGWFDVQLPDGATLDSMTVRGGRTGVLTDFSVSLLRQPLEGATAEPATLIQIQLSAAANPFEESAQVDPARISSSSGLDPLAAQVAAVGFRQIDNSQYKYLISARLAGGNSDTNAQLTSIQLACRDF